MDKETGNVHADMCFQGSALRLPAHAPPRWCPASLFCCPCREGPEENTGWCPSPAAQFHSATPESAQGTAGIPWVGSQSSEKVGLIGQHKSILIKRPSTVNRLHKTEKGMKEETTEEVEIKFTKWGTKSHIWRKLQTSAMTCIWAFPLASPGMRCTQTTTYQRPPALSHAGAPGQGAGAASPLRWPTLSLSGCCGDEFSLAVSALCSGVSKYPHLSEITQRPPGARIWF